jgi:hypothetical protein
VTVCQHNASCAAKPGSEALHRGAAAPSYARRGATGLAGPSRAGPAKPTRPAREENRDLFQPSAGSAADLAEDEVGRVVLVAVEVGQVDLEIATAGAERVTRVAPSGDLVTAAKAGQEL